jgi:hypothetical protein
MCCLESHELPVEVAYICIGIKLSTALCNHNFHALCSHHCHTLAFKTLKSVVSFPHTRVAQRKHLLTQSGHAFSLSGYVLMEYTCSLVPPAPCIILFLCFCCILSFDSIPLFLQCSAYVITVLVLSLSYLPTERT